MRISDWSSDVCSSDLRRDSRRWSMSSGVSVVTSLWRLSSVRRLESCLASMTDLSSLLPGAGFLWGKQLIGDVTPPEIDEAAIAPRQPFQSQQQVVENIDVALDRAVLVELCNAQPNCIAAINLDIAGDSVADGALDRKSTRLNSSH